jgi:hypothetical protein
VSIALVLSGENPVSTPTPHRAGRIHRHRGKIRRAARIWGGVEGYRDARDIPWAPDEREMIEPHIDAARTRLDEAAWEEEWERGRSMTLDQTVGYALEGVGDRAMEQG